MLDYKRIKHPALKRFVRKGDKSKIQPQWLDKVRRILAALNVAVTPEELDLPGYAFHRLKGNRRNTFSVRISGNWRITFKWDDDGPFEVDMEDYHGK